MQYHSSLVCRFPSLRSRLRLDRRDRHHLHDRTTISDRHQLTPEASATTVDPFCFTSWLEIGHPTDHSEKSELTPSSPVEINLMNPDRFTTPRER